jgi:hypothetical protein
MKKLKNEDPYPKMGEIKNISVKKDNINKEILDELNKKSSIANKELSDEDNLELYYLLLESIWISRWTDERQQSLYAVLIPEEAEEAVKDILKDLDDNGFKIVKK